VELCGAEFWGQLQQQQQQSMIYFLTVLIVIDTAHNLSPMVMAWSRGDVRAMMYRRWIFYVALPLVFLGGSLGAAMTAAPGARYGEAPVVDAIVNVYYMWNIWHFASQNYGLLKLWGCKLDWAIRGAALTIVGMSAIPALAIYSGWAWEWRVAGFALLSIPHWISEIAITSWVSARWKVFLPLILALGCLGLLIATPRASGNMVVVGVWLVCIRYGFFGGTHFLYDGLLWRFHNPEIRATIGKGLGLASS